MSEPVFSTSVTATGLAYLTDDNAKPNIKALTGIYLQVFQDIETAIAATYLSRQVAFATGAQLDLIGKLVGQLRANFSDAEYKTLIYARILTNRSDGTGRAITEIISAMIKGTTTTASFVDTSNMKFQITFFVPLSAALMNAWASMLQSAKALGSGMDIFYSSSTASASLIADTYAGGYTTSVLDTYVTSNQGEACAQV